MNLNAVNLKLQILNAKANPGQKLIDERCDAFVESGIDLFKKQVKPFVNFLNDINDYPTPGKLFDYYSKMKTGDLENRMLNLSFASEITGKLVVRDLELTPVKSYMDRVEVKAKLVPEMELIFDMSPEDAVAWLRDKGVDISEDWLDTIEILKKHCFTVAKVQSADILQEIQGELVRAMDEGITFNEWKKNIDVIFTNHGYYPQEGGAYRLDTVYRMNMQGSYMRGRWLEQLEVKEDFPWWEAVATLDNRTTDGCKGINGIVLPSDDDFWATNYPMRHFLCRLTVRSVSKWDRDKRGIKISDPNEKVMIDGEEMKIKDVKPAKGFDVLPDAIWKPDLSKYDPILKKKIEKDIE